MAIWTATTLSLALKSVFEVAKAKSHFLWDAVGPCSLKLVPAKHNKPLNYKIKFYINILHNGDITHKRMKIT